MVEFAKVYQTDTPQRKLSGETTRILSATRGQALEGGKPRRGKRAGSMSGSGERRTEAQRQILQRALTTCCAWLALSVLPGKRQAPNKMLLQMLPHLTPLTLRTPLSTPHLQTISQIKQPDIERVFFVVVVLDSLSARRFLVPYPNCPFLILSTYSKQAKKKRSHVLSIRV